MSADATIYPVMDSIGCISQFLEIRREIASLRRERPAIHCPDRVSWIPGLAGLEEPVTVRIFAFGRKVLLRR